MKHKQDEESLQEMRSMESEFRGQISDLMSQLVAVQLRAHELETASAAARAEFDNEKQAWVSELQQRIDEERAKWREERLGQNVHLPSRAESPPVPNRRGLTSEFLGLQNVQTRRPVSRSSTSEFQGAPLSERLKSRRMSNQPSPLLRSPTHATAESQDTSALILSNGDLPGTPSIQTFDADEFFEHHRSASPQQTLNDMGSVSTAAAGPSVQLIERMSSAVRKLESEKAASKEQMLRLAAQRDEARAEIVALMKEVEIKREAEKKVAQIEHDMKNMNDRYQTTLEMLGEKSELVDELRGDIDEIKTMYRDLVERTVR